MPWLAPSPSGAWPIEPTSRASTGAHYYWCMSSIRRFGPCSSSATSPKPARAVTEPTSRTRTAPTTPWLAGLYWPYRVTADTEPFEVPGSGGFEGMAISPSKRFLYPLLEKPLVDSAERDLLIHRFDTKKGAYNGRSVDLPPRRAGSRHRRLHPLQGKEGPRDRAGQQPG